MAAWNSNGLQQRAIKTKTFLYNNNIDILLVSGTHFTPKSYTKIPYCTIYDTKHLLGKAQTGTAVIIRNDIKHHLHSEISQECVQVTTVRIQTNSNYIQMSAVYTPPRHKMAFQKWEQYFQSLGDKYIAVGNFNAKHRLWGSRINKPRGRTLEKYIGTSNLNILSTGRPTYWPTDLNKIPFFFDFAVIKGLYANKLKITPNLELSSDHTPIIIECTSRPILYSNPESLCNKTAKWQTFKELIERKINCNAPLNTPKHIEQVVATLTEIILEAAWAITIYEPNNRRTKIIPTDIFDKIREERKTKAKWQKHRTGENKKYLNKLAKEIKSKIKDQNNNEFSKFIETFSAHGNANYSLWKVTNKIKKPVKLITAIRKADSTWAYSI